MLSLSARRAWIEMTYVTRLPRAQVVALRKESVDRNWYCLGTRVSETLVALRKESVDRNSSIDNLTQGVFVALRKESVDRNSSGAKADSVTKCRSPQGERG